MLKHHAHMLTNLVNVNLGIRDVLSIEPDFTAGGSLQKVQAA